MKGHILFRGDNSEIVRICIDKCFLRTNVINANKHKVFSDIRD